jgi:hypothetical protein
MQKPPDIVLLGAEWPARALIRAQLIEEGHDVVAIDAWPIPRRYRQPDMKPRVMLIDLQGLPHPQQTLDEVRLVLPPERVVVVTALGTLTVKHVRELGYTVVERPTTIGEITSAVGALLSSSA